MNRLTPQQALQKIKSFCAYQERSHHEVKSKLYTFGLRSSEIENITSELIEQNYLNEERFAKLFVGGKFRIKNWGRIKIVNELKLKRISNYNIQLALQEIDEQKYIRALEKLARTKWNSLKHEQYINRQAKTIRYLLQKGFEINLIKIVIDNIRKQIFVKD